MESPPILRRSLECGAQKVEASASCSLVSVEVFNSLSFQPYFNQEQTFIIIGADNEELTEEEIFQSLFCEMTSSNPTNINTKNKMKSSNLLEVPEDGSIKKVKNLELRTSTGFGSSPSRNITFNTNINLQQDEMDKEEVEEDKRILGKRKRDGGSDQSNDGRNRDGVDITKRKKLNCDRRVSIVQEVEMMNEDQIYF